MQSFPLNSYLHKNVVNLLPLTAYLYHHYLRTMTDLLFSFPIKSLPFSTVASSSHSNQFNNGLHLKLCIVEPYVMLSITISYSSPHNVNTLLVFAELMEPGIAWMCRFQVEHLRLVMRNI